MSSYLVNCKNAINRGNVELIKIDEVIIFRAELTFDRKQSTKCSRHMTISIRSYVPVLSVMSVTVMSSITKEFSAPPTPEPERWF